MDGRYVLTPHYLRGSRGQQTSSQNRGRLTIGAYYDSCITFCETVDEDPPVTVDGFLNMSAGVGKIKEESLWAALGYIEVTILNIE